MITTLARTLTTSYCYYSYSQLCFPIGYITRREGGTDTPYHHHLQKKEEGGRRRKIKDEFKIEHEHSLQAKANRYQQAIGNSQRYIAF